jgi:hypothetical protein
MVTENQSNKSINQIWAAFSAFNINLTSIFGETDHEIKQKKSSQFCIQRTPYLNLQNLDKLIILGQNNDFQN